MDWTQALSEVSRDMGAGGLWTWEGLYVWVWRTVELGGLWMQGLCGRGRYLGKVGPLYGAQPSPAPAVAPAIIGMLMPGPARDPWLHSTTSNLVAAHGMGLAQSTHP